MPKLLPVKSKALSHIGYEAGNLWVQVRDNKAIFVYLNVPQEHYHWLLSAPSIGSYWNNKIKPRYRYVKGQRKPKQADYQPPADISAYMTLYYQPHTGDSYGERTVILWDEPLFSCPGSGMQEVENANWAGTAYMLYMAYTMMPNEAELPPSIYFAMFRDNIITTRCLEPIIEHNELPALHLHNGRLSWSVRYGASESIAANS